MSRVLTCTLFFGAFLATACSGPASDAPAPAAGEPPVVEAEMEAPEAVVVADTVSVDGAFIVKPAAGRDIASGGLVLSVTGTAKTLTGAQTSIAETVELHTMSMEDGTMKMRKVESFDVSEGAPLTLERGGNHLMFFGVSDEMAIGDSVEITLTLADADGTVEEVSAQADVIGLAD